MKRGVRLPWYRTGVMEANPARVVWLRRAAVGCAVAVGAWTRSPLLGAPPTMDDHLQQALLDGTGPVSRPAWALFDFVRRGEAPALRDAGLLPWWTDDAFALVMFRPLTSATLWLDHALGWGPVGGHLHSLAWWLGMLAATGWALRPMLPSTVGALALGLCAMSPTWTVPLGWMANRGVLVAGALGWAALGLWVRERWALATGAMLLAALGGEYALGPCLVGLVWTLRGPRASHCQLSRWAPAAGLGAILVLGRVLGAGAAGGRAYLDPLGAPGEFLRALPERLGCLFAEALLMLNTVGPDGSAVGSAALPGWAAAFVLALAVRRVRAGAEPSARRGLDALGLGGVAALVAFGAVPVHGRVVAPVMACAAAMVAAVLLGARAGGAPTWLRGVGLALAGLHLVAGPWRARVDAVGLRWVAEASTAGLVAGGEAARGARRVVLLAAPHPEMLHYTPMLWRRRLGIAVDWTVLAATGAPVRRVFRADGGVDLEAGGVSLVAPWAWGMYRRGPLHVGHTQGVADMTVTVTEAPGGVPSRLRVRGVGEGVRWMRARAWGLGPLEGP